MTKLTRDDGTKLYVEAGAVECVVDGHAGGARVQTRGWCYDVREPIDEIVRLIEEAAHPTTDAACAAVVEAARRLIAWLDDPNATYGAHEAIVHDLRSALAAMEAPHE